MNPWITHLMKFRAENPNLKFKDALKEARSSYTPIIQSTSREEKKQAFFNSRKKK